MKTMTVGELAEMLLENFPVDMPVTILGHFGEPVKIDARDFGVGTVQGHDGWAFPVDKSIPIGTKVLVLPKADIGPYPD